MLSVRYLLSRCMCSACWDLACITLCHNCYTGLQAHQAEPNSPSFKQQLELTQLVLPCRGIRGDQTMRRPSEQHTCSWTEDDHGIRLEAEVRDSAQAYSVAAKLRLVCICTPSLPPSLSLSPANANHSNLSDSACGYDHCQLQLTKQPSAIRGNQPCRTRSAATNTQPKTSTLFA